VRHERRLRHERRVRHERRAERRCYSHGHCTTVYITTRAPTGRDG
jgi:hypothetical protein